MFQPSVSLGTIVALERQTCAALAGAHDQARDAVRAAPVKSTDETGWKRDGSRCWLGIAATASVAFFVVHVQRGKPGRKALLGEVVCGVVISDRWSAYHGLPLDQRQIGWAHRKRDFQKCVERGGVGRMVGQSSLAVVEDVFTLRRDFRQRRIKRVSLQEQLETPAEELRESLVRRSG